MDYIADTVGINDESILYEVIYIEMKRVNILQWISFILGLKIG